MNKLKKILLTVLATITILTSTEYDAYADVNVKFHGTLVATTCYTNAVDVDFGEVSLDTIQPITRMGRAGGTGSTYKTFTVTVTCSGAITQGIKYQVSGNVAAFHNNVLATNVSGLGIALMNYPGLADGLKIGTWYEFDSGTHEWAAVLARDSSVTLSGGDFLGTATLTVQLP